MSSEIMNLLDEIERQKGINRQVILEALESALVSAYRKHYGTFRDIKVKIIESTGDIEVVIYKTVVESVNVLDNEISFEDAKLLDSCCSIGDSVEIVVTPESFGRIAAQTARQVVLQRVREAERNRTFGEYSDKTNDILVGTIRKVERKNVLLEIDNMESVLAPSEQVSTDKYYVGRRIKVYVCEVVNSAFGVQLIVSRSHPAFVKKLLELEVPEIRQEIIEIKALSREPGLRTKIAVASNNPKIDPVGTCVGVHGLRVKNVTDELGGERIDVIKYSEDLQEFISQSISPAKVLSIEFFDDGKRCKIVVPKDQLSLAIGKGGQNVRLAARLTKVRLDITSE